MPLLDQGRIGKLFCNAQRGSQKHTPGAEMNCLKYPLPLVPPKHTVHLPKAEKQNKNELMYEIKSRTLIEILLAAEMQEWLASEDALVTRRSASCHSLLPGYKVWWGKGKRNLPSFITHSMCFICFSLQFYQFQSQQKQFGQGSGNRPWFPISFFVILCPSLIGAGHRQLLLQSAGKETGY